MSPHRILTILLAAIVAVILCGSAAAQPNRHVRRSHKSHAVKQDRELRVQVMHTKEGINFYRQRAWFWEQNSLMPRTHSEFLERHVSQLGTLHWSLSLWYRRSQQARRYAQSLPHRSLWMCIHDHEKSSWYDPASPYYGGLQMGDGFMKHYAPDVLARFGTAEHWTPLMQMWVAERQYKREGYSRSWVYGQWPNTHVGCI